MLSPGTRVSNFGIRILKSVRAQKARQRLESPSEGQKPVRGSKARQRVKKPVRARKARQRLESPSEGRKPVRGSKARQSSKTNLYPKI